jgi:hypothetical protein
MSESIWLILDRVGIIAGLLAFLGTTYSAFRWWKHQRRQKELEAPISIQLIDATTTRILLILPYQPPRRSITRAEVLGVLGMIPSRQQRFDWAWLHEARFMQQLEEVHRGERHVLEIPITESEFSQLEIP